MRASPASRLAKSVFQSVQSLWSLDKVSDSLRVFIALAAVMAACSLSGASDLIIPLFLGVIAGALAETDDSWQGRAKAVVLTVALFALSAFCVEFLTPYPWLFVAAMAASTFTLSMSGALGPRYVTIAQATLILAVYAMLSLEQAAAGPNLWRLPLLLTLGAAWYGALSVLWQALFPFRPVRQGLASLFDRVGEYLESKSALFEPRRRQDIESARVRLAHRNGTVVIALNQVQELIRRRVRSGRGDDRIERFLGQYFVAQDIYERASSSHHPYDEFTRAFFHSDVMFRCQLLLRQQGRACWGLARAQRESRPFDYGQTREALDDLRASLDYLKTGNLPEQRDLLPSLGDLVNNLEALESNLARADDPADGATRPDKSLFDDSPRTLAEAWRRVAQHLTPTSSVFRHAVRLSLALGVGYAVKNIIHPAQGYWIVLTTLFVCLPNYASTRRRLGQRVSGTVLGLIAGWALITLFPAPDIQRLIAVAAGVAFFVWRADRYTLATGAITLMVVCCFNQVANGYGIIWPRLLDTLLGSLISGLAVFFVLPDWQRRQADKVVAGALSGASGYLRALIRQYGSGKRDDLDYRVARRAAQEADATLSSMLSNMLQEPGRYRRDVDFYMRLQVLSHTLLSHLSTLGAHRDALPALSPEQPLARTALRIADSLDSIAADLSARRPPLLASGVEAQAARELETFSGEIDDRERLVRSQLTFICRQLPPMRQLASQLPGDAKV